MQALGLLGQKPTQKVETLLFNGDYEEAIHAIEEIEKSLSKQAYNELMLVKVEAFLLLGNVEKAQLSLPPEQSNALWHNRAGEVQMALGRNDRALEHFEKALALSDTDLYKAMTFNNLGLAHWNDGNNTLALEYHFRALDIRRALVGEAHEQTASSYNNIGLVYAGQDNDNALTYYDKALTVFQKVYPAQHPKIASVLVNIGIINRQLELYGDALNHLEAARKIWQKIEPKGHPNEAFILLNLGQTYLQMGQNSTAAQFYAQALAMYEAQYGKKHPAIANTLNLIGRLQMLEEKYAEAIGTFHEAALANIPGTSLLDRSATPSVSGYYNATILLSSLQEKARALEEFHFGKSLKPKDLLLAFQTIQACDTLIETIRRQRTHKTDKIILGNTAQEVYEDGVRIAYSLYEGSLKKYPWLEQAYLFAEKSKSAVLLDAISEAKAKSFAGIPSTVLEEEKSLTAELALVEQLLAQKPEATVEAALRLRLFEANRKHATFTQQLEETYPDYFNLKYNFQQPRVSDLQGMLDKETALISYFIADRTERIYQFVITHNKIAVHSVPKSPDFDKWLTGYRNSLFFSVDEIFLYTGIELYRQLFPRNIPRGIRELVIVPAGRLGTVPFESLITTRKTRPNAAFNEIPFLVRNYAVRYEYSSALFAQRKKTSLPSVASNILVCAPVHFENTYPEVPNLPATREEAQAISRLFSTKNLKATLITESGASEDFIKGQTLRDFTYLHFATHGLVNESNPELSRLFLLPGAGEDGLLYAGEIYNLQLKARLVTLSACQTGLGKISRGEGIIGLSRAFLYAGAESLIVSQWSVADVSTAQMMTDFYQAHLTQGEQKTANSLRQAKINLLDSEEFSSPYYWAPFVLIGN
jgi:tetratricopeptide (TPR) repeat protein